jgi:hypothetical protein
MQIILEGATARPLTAASSFKKLDSQVKTVETSVKACPQCEIRVAR